MAYFSNFNPFGEDEEDQLQTGQGQAAPNTTGGFTTATAGSASGLSGPSPSGPAGGGGGSGVPGSKFVNFDRLLSANKENVDRDVNNVNSMVDTEAGKADKAGEAYTTGFNTDVKSGTAAFTPSTPSQNSPNLAGPGEFPSSNYATAATPASVSQQTAYSGPTNPFDPKYKTQELMDQTQTAQSKLGGLGNSGGLAQLLKDKYGAGGSQGASDMSAALTGAVGGEKFKNTQNKYGDLVERLTGRFKDARTTAGEAPTLGKHALALYGADPTNPANAPPPAPEAPTMSMPDSSGRRFNYTSGQWEDPAPAASEPESEEARRQRLGIYADDPRYQ